MNTKNARYCKTCKNQGLNSSVRTASQHGKKRQHLTRTPCTLHEWQEEKERSGELQRKQEPQGQNESP